ncbi:MAG: hypothetical protein JNJ65_00035 [Cyclobacteriaceae bacterium]|nr:hypothetical protein [Cyclobacteriaceae bacterium]
MENDSLKKFVDQHRQEFDHHVPSEKVWARIASNLPRQISLWNNVVVWRAAAGLFLALSLYLFVTSTNPSVSTGERAHLQGEFNDLETFYSEQIADKVELISDIQGFEDEQFTQDMQKLEAMYQVLRDQMKSNPTPQVKDALILNLLVRIDLLNQQLKTLEDSQKPKHPDSEV